MELEYNTICYLTSDPFGYLVPTHFSHADYEGRCLITWWTFLLLEACEILVYTDIPTLESLISGDPLSLVTP